MWQNVRCITSFCTTWHNSITVWLREFERTDQCHASAQLINDAPPSDVNSSNLMMLACLLACLRACLLACLLLTLRTRARVTLVLTPSPLLRRCSWRPEKYLCQSCIWERQISRVSSNPWGCHARGVGRARAGYATKPQEPWVRAHQQRSIKKQGWVTLAWKLRKLCFLAGSGLCKFKFVKINLWCAFEKMFRGSYSLHMHKVGRPLEIRF